MSDDTGTWSEALRGPWTVLCAVATVVLGPRTAIVSALDQANAAPLHHGADQPHG
ncbi:hypothetical protein AB0O67_29350 [Streptomyces sp. NPDC086077]|uniref:hypothetical protein n=1 Tax=Streptomyces sp. NPDC086077 TaxID=3154862 RepID=UPI0034324379